MNGVNEQFEKYVGLHKEMLAPAQAIGGVMVETFERLAKQNYDVLGDYVNFAVAQFKLPAQVENVNELVGRQIETSRVFGEKLTERAKEYVEILRNEQSKAESIMAANEVTEGKRTKKAA